jgi:hypothetical protein
MSSLIDDLCYVRCAWWMMLVIWRLGLLMSWPWWLWYNKGVVNRNPLTGFVDGWYMVCELSAVNEIVIMEGDWWAGYDDCCVVGGKIILVMLDGGFCFNLIVTLCGADDVVHEENRWLWTFGWNQCEARGPCWRAPLKTTQSALVLFPNGYVVPLTIMLVWTLYDWRYCYCGGYLMSWPRWLWYH